MWLQVSVVLAMVGSSGALRGRGVDGPKWSDDLELPAARFDPRNYIGKLRPEDTAENLHDYALLFEAGAGKSILIAGDSMMRQLHYAAKYAAKILGYYTEEEADGGCLAWAACLVVKRTADAPNQTALRLVYYGFFRIAELTGLDNSSPPFHELFRRHHDLLAVNIGHYIYKEPRTFTYIAKRFFEGLKKRADATASRIAFFDHPPQHFNTDNGDYWENDVGDGHDCSCTQPHLMQQYTKINNGLAASFAREYGFDYVALWDDMNLCNEHPYDCTHFTMSPSIFKTEIKSLANILAR